MCARPHTQRPQQPLETSFFPSSRGNKHGQISVVPNIPHQFNHLKSVNIYNWYVKNNSLTLTKVSLAETMKAILFSKMYFDAHF